MDEELLSFPFCEKVNGIEHAYRITEKEGSFGIEKDGILIAEVQNNEVWRQTSGEPLNKELLQKIYDRIEDHYE